MFSRQVMDTDMSTGMATGMLTLVITTLTYTLMVINTAIRTEDTAVEKMTGTTDNIMPTEITDTVRGNIGIANMTKTLLWEKKYAINAAVPIVQDFLKTGELSRVLWEIMKQGNGIDMRI